MSNAHWALILLGGCGIGVLVGMLGTSGAITIPVLVYVFGLTQLRAQGTSLFIACMPIWIAPLIPYVRAGNVDWRFGFLIAAGIAVGGYFGGQLAQSMSTVVLRRSFAVALAAVALRMFFQR